MSAVMKARARLGGFSRHRGPDDPATEAARAGLDAAKADAEVDEHIRCLAAEAPPLSAEQVQRIRDLLPPVSTVDGGGHG